MTSPDPTTVASLYLAAFAPRTDVHQRWGLDHWVAVREELTPEIVIAGLRRQGPTIGAYFPAIDGTAPVLAIDVDLPDGWDVARRIAKAMWAGDVPAFVERSARGAHLWAPCLPAIPTIVAIRAMRAFLADAGITDCPNDGSCPQAHCGDGAGRHADPRLELRPEKDRASAEGFGKACRLPLMPHGKTGERWMLSWPDGKPLGASVTDVVSVIYDVDWATEEQLAAAAERWSPPAEPEREVRDREDRPRSIERFNDSVGVTEVLVADWQVMNAQPGRAVRCPAHDDRSPSLSILKDDRRVICHSPSCDFNNGGQGRDAYDLARLAGARPGAAA